MGRVGLEAGVGLGLGLVGGVSFTSGAGSGTGLVGSSESLSGSVFDVLVGIVTGSDSCSEVDEIGLSLFGVADNDDCSGLSIVFAKLNTFNGSDCGSGACLISVTSEVSRSFAAFAFSASVIIKLSKSSSNLERNAHFN